MGTPMWQGEVLSVHDDAVFTAMLTSDDGHAQVLADFDLALLPQVQPGDLITMSEYRLARNDLGRWEQVD